MQAVTTIGLDIAKSVFQVARLYDLRVLVGTIDEIGGRIAGSSISDTQLGLGIGQDPGMVKCEVNVAHIDPFGAYRVRPYSWLRFVREHGHECHANNMASRVAIDIGKTPTRVISAT